VTRKTYSLAVRRLPGGDRPGQYLTLDDSDGIGEIYLGLASTVVVAASDASAEVREWADYVCDGIADNVEIQAAIAALPAGGGKVVLSEGTFTVIAQITPVSGITIEGQGWSTILKIADNTDGLNGVIGDATDGSVGNWAARNLHIDGNKANQVSANDFRGVNLYGDRVRVENLYVHDIKNQDGIIINRYSTGAIVKDCLVTDCDDMGYEIIDGAADALIVDCVGSGNANFNFSIHSHIGTAACVRCAIVNGISVNSGNKGFRIGGFAGLESVGCSLVNCKDTGAASNGIQVTLAYDSVVADCYSDSLISSESTSARTSFIGCKSSGAGFSIYGRYDTLAGCSVNGGVVTIYGDHVSVNGLTHNGTNGVNNFGIAIFNGANYCTVNGCTVYGEDAGARYGIWLRGAQNCSIVGNTVEGWTGSGIRLNTQSAVNPTGNVISGNRVEGCGIGISEEASGDNNLIQGNDVTGNTTPLAFVGASTLARNNKGSLVDGKIADPGNAEAIPVVKSGWVPLVTAGAETRTLAAPSLVGQELTLYCKTFVGNCVVTCATTVNEAGNNTITFSATGQACCLYAVEEGSNLRWRLASVDGATLSTV